MGLLALGQRTQTDVTQPGLTAQCLTMACHCTLPPPAAGGSTCTVHTHSARQSDGWVLALFVMIRTGQYEYTHSQMGSHQGRCPLSPNSCTVGSVTLYTQASAFWSLSTHFSSYFLTSLVITLSVGESFMMSLEVKYITALLPEHLCSHAHFWACVCLSFQTNEA